MTITLYHVWKRSSAIKQVSPSPSRSSMTWKQELTSWINFIAKEIKDQVCRGFVVSRFSNYCSLLKWSWGFFVMTCWKNTSSGVPQNNARNLIDLEFSYQITGLHGSSVFFLFAVGIHEIANFDTFILIEKQLFKSALSKSVYLECTWIISLR